MDIGVSELTNTIYAGKSRALSDKESMWVGKKTDITDSAIAAVFQWFVNNFKSTECEIGFEVTFPSSDYVLTLTKKSSLPEDNIVPCDCSF